MAQARRRTRTKTRSSMGSIASKSTSAVKKTSNAGGLKGGISRATHTRGVKGGMSIIRKYADQARKNFGSKGGAAAIMGGAAGIALGAAIGGMIAAKKNHHTINTALNAAESISKHADDLKKAAGKK
jgi:hypothetical protein